MKQVDLFGFDVMQCKKCSRCFATMIESSRHHATKHRKITITKTTVNFALENYCLVSEKITSKTIHAYHNVRGGERE